MRALKIICVLFCLISLARFVAIVHGIRSPQTGSPVTILSVVAAIWSLVFALMWALEFYGIQRKTVFAWKLGWGILAASFLQFLALAMSSVLKLRDTEHPWVAFVGVLVGGSLVALYWSSWWERQKGYFTAHSPKVLAEK
jgi:hypothetical protein